MAGTSVTPYLFFDGNLEEALEFYKRAAGAQVDVVMRYSEAPDQPPPGMLAPGFEHKIMHSSFRIGETTIMASDGCGTEPVQFKGFSLALTVPTAEEAERAFAALAEGGKVEMPLGKTFWSPLFGMLADRYGIGWMVSVSEADASADRG